ncbi:uncharacterized protein [Triticum aestivum]|uniref:uncharacterized protein n=1 Tax=Triticum aestivum TaxID=4565 RepID=UPI0008433964|nr:uncharacterized protein LOC123170809 [Triticum aestivum]
MSLRRLLGLSAAAAAVPGRPRRSLATAAAHPPWAIVKRWAAAADEPAPGALVHLDHPPRLSCLGVPKHLLTPMASPAADSYVNQIVTGSVRAASADGLLLLSYVDERVVFPVLAEQGAAPLRNEPTEHAVSVTRLVCNPVTGQLSRLPPALFYEPHVRKLMCGKHTGLLTRAGRGHDGHGPPDRFAVAALQGDRMARFLSETGRWESLPVSTCQLPLERAMVLDREVVAFGGRLWWLDATCGTISADPFSDRPELCFVELPRGSVLPAAAPRDCPDCGDPCGGCGTSKHRRLCVSQGRLRYLEVSQEEPFVLSCFVLDVDKRGGWTLEHRLDLSRYEAHRYGHPWLPLKGENTPQVGFLDPLDANVVYMSACITTLENTPRVVFVVDMKIDLPFRSYAYRSGEPCFVPCVLPPWLGSSQIPSAGKKSVKKNKSLADVLVRADNLQKR